MGRQPGGQLRTSHRPVRPEWRRQDNYHSHDPGNHKTQQRQYRTAEADSLNSQREAVSGVNIDDELVTMIKFQRAYEASAKVITTSNTMLDSLLGLIR